MRFISKDEFPNYQQDTWNENQSQDEKPASFQALHQNVIKINVKNFS